MTDLKVYHSVPLRLSLFLTRTEHNNLSQMIDGLLTKWDVPEIVEALEKRVRAQHRIVRGVHSDGTFEYRYHKGDGENDERNVNALAFWHSEFPATANEWGDLLPEDESPVEFLLTSRFAAVLFVTDKKKRKVKPLVQVDPSVHSRLVVRRGMVEASYVLEGLKVASVADAIIAVDPKGYAAASAWLEPVSTEIAECHMLS